MSFSKMAKLRLLHLLSLSRPTHAITRGGRLDAAQRAIQRAIRRSVQIVLPVKKCEETREIE